MKNIKVKYLLEYISLGLILSYFFIHNIFLVVIGITFSFYLINIDFINRFIRDIKKRSFTVKVSRELKKNYKTKESDPINVKLVKRESKLSLVETIEELGFIPSKDKNDDSTAA